MTKRTEWAVVETANPLALHCLTWSRERAEKWIAETGAHFFPDVEFVALPPEGLDRVRDREGGGDGEAS